MYINEKTRVCNPLKNPQGETVYELIGSAVNSGGAGLHSLAVIVMPPGCSSQRHYHKVGEETYYILSGSASMMIDDHEFILTPGQACLIQPNESHQITNNGKENLEFIAVCAPAWTPANSYTSS
jgi:mannose-6-phosphate isomerase-like protein (cupin superfamily)